MCKMMCLKRVSFFNLKIREKCKLFWQAHPCSVTCRLSLLSREDCKGSFRCQAVQELSFGLGLAGGPVARASIGSLRSAGGEVNHSSCSGVR